MGFGKKDSRFHLPGRKAEVQESGGPARTPVAATISVDTLLRMSSAKT